MRRSKILAVALLSLSCVIGSGYAASKTTATAINEKDSIAEFQAASTAKSLNCKGALACSQCWQANHCGANEKCQKDCNCCM